MPTNFWFLCLVLSFFVGDHWSWFLSELQQIWWLSFHHFLFELLSRSSPEIWIFLPFIFSHPNISDFLLGAWSLSFPTYWLSPQTFFSTTVPRSFLSEFHYMSFCKYPSFLIRRTSFAVCCFILSVWAVRFHVSFSEFCFTLLIFKFRSLWCSSQIYHHLPFRLAAFWMS